MKYFSTRWGHCLTSIGLSVVVTLMTGCSGEDTSALLSIPAEPMLQNEEVTRYTSVSEENFCKGGAPEQCFTLVLGVPAPALEENLGLNTLSLAGQVEKFRVPLIRSCHKGLKAYVRGHQGRWLNKRNQLFSTIKESRCIIDLIDRETYDVADLPQGQFGLAARLSDWGINGSVSENDLTVLKVTLHSATLAVSYRDAKVFAQPADETLSMWSDLLSNDYRPFGGFTPMATQNFTQNFAGDLSLNFSSAGTIEKMADVLDQVKNMDVSASALRNFFKEASRITSAVAAGDLFTPGAAFIGIGLDALKAICQESCNQFDTTTINAITKIKESFGDTSVVDSYTNSLFSDSHMVLPAKIIDDAFWHANGAELAKSLGWEAEQDEDLYDDPFDPFDDQW